MKLVIGDDYHATALELISLPITLYHLHGSYWTNHLYFWVYAIIAGVLAIVSIITFALRMWQSILMLSVAAFATVFCEKTYQIARVVFAAELSLWSDIRNLINELVYTLFVHAVCIELLPLIFALVYISRAHYRPTPWSIVGIIVCVGCLFVGSGWYVGPGLIGLSSLIIFFSRVVPLKKLKI